MKPMQMVRQVLRNISDRVMRIVSSGVVSAIKYRINSIITIQNFSTLDD